MSFCFNHKLHVVLREFTRCSWIPGCRKLIQERGNIRGEFTQEATEESAGENLGGARGSKERF